MPSRLEGANRHPVAGLALFAVVLLLAACGGGTRTLPPEMEDSGDRFTSSEYELGQGDRLLVTVYDRPELSGERVVDGSGNIAMPLVGTVAAGGATADELQSRIVDTLQPQYLTDPRVSVQILSYRPFYILGEVKNPGSYPYVNDMLITNAVALAGGFTYRAEQDEFYITRRSDPQRRRLEVGPNTRVRPGDVVIVQERFF